MLLQRQYVRKERKQLVPESRGRILTAFLEHFFPRYIDYAFRCAASPGARVGLWLGASTRVASRQTLPKSNSGQGNSAS